MINLKLKNRGESLAEVLVSVGIIVMVLVVSFTLVNRGVSTNVSVKNKILAINIAREGIEGMRNIRDTNWLRYSGDRRNKWLCFGTDCSFDVSLGWYVLKFKDSRFGIDENVFQGDLDLSSVADDFSVYRLYKDAVTAKYTHNSGPAENENLPTNFYRQLKLTPAPPPECDGSGNYDCDVNSVLHVVSRVQWQEESLVGTIVMETYLYDYYDRKKYVH